MKSYPFYVLCTLFWLSACEAPLAQSPDAASSTSPTDTVEIAPPLQGLIAYLGTPTDTAARISRLALYDEPLGDVVDSLYMIHHLGGQVSLYTRSTAEDQPQFILPDQGDRFAYPWQNKYHEGWVFCEEKEHHYRVLCHTRSQGSYWIREADFQAYSFEAILWDSLFDRLTLGQHSALLQATEWIIYSDSTLQVPLDTFHQGSEQFFHLHQAKGDTWELSGYRVSGWQRSLHQQYVPVLAADSVRGWTSMLDKTGKPVLTLSGQRFQRQHQQHGIGYLSGHFKMYNHFARRERVPFEDSLLIYDASLNKQIGAVPKLGTTLYTYEAYVNLDGTKDIYFNSDLDRMDGMSDMQGLKIYSNKQGHIRMFSGRYDSLETWIKVADLDTGFSVHTWREYLQARPKGNSGWEHGYAWIGGLDYVRTEAHESAPAVLTLNKSVEIYLTGAFQGNWAQVEVKEVGYKYGETYFEKATYGHTWKGWMKIVDEAGHPLLYEVILGC